jgi:hypothetical protein
MSRPSFLLFGLALAAGAAQAQTIVSSPGPERVAVTVYREPGREAGRSLDLGWLEGYALVSETRQVTIPVGESEIRFEGVAGGLVPQSAIISGLPEGIVERNRDAYLLSPATLLDRSLGRRAHLRRTSAATGAVTETEAEISSGAEGAVVLRTRDGYEALRCTGLAETLSYDSVPAGLSARPTLSVRARSSQAVTATVTLSYLANGFDWQANYIASLSADGRHIDLFAWLTLASMDETGFVDADAQAVAGQLRRTATSAEPPEGDALSLRCWPQGTTSAIPLAELASRDEDERGGDNIVVTGSRIRRPNLESTVPITSVNAEEFASQEALGDLKLFRLPSRVTIASHSQKQVALLARQHVRVRSVYRQNFFPPSPWREWEEPVHRYLLTRNREAEGLGLPLPAGQLVLFGGDSARPILLGEGSVDDQAVGQDVEIDLTSAPGIRADFCMAEYRGGVATYRITVANDGTEPAAYEATLDFANLRADVRLGQRYGKPLWQVDIPANGHAVLGFRADLPEDRRPRPGQPGYSCPGISPA